MSTTLIERPNVTEPSRARPDRWRWTWLAVGSLMAMLAVHGQWDVPLAAWLFSVFFLRFTRSSRPLVGLGLVWLVSAAAAVFWVWQVAVPMTVVTVVGAVALASVLVVPYVADRFVATRLGVVGSLLLFPVAHAAGEYLLAVISPFGTAFGLLAATQHGNLPLLQVISVAGPYAIGFLIALAATVTNAAWERRLHGARALAVVGAYAALLALVIGAGGARMAWFPPSADTVRVAGLSPGKAQTLALTTAFGGRPPSLQAQEVAGRDPSEVGVAFSAVNDELLGRTQQVADSGARIVIWSEQAANVLVADEPRFLAAAATVAREKQIYLQVAAYVYLPQAPWSANRTVLIDPTGTVVWTYDKTHPIPGLENYPGGPGTVPVADTPYGRLATVTCFDADFPALTRVDADILLVPARDWQQIGAVHSQKASLRPIENGYSIVRQAEFGIAAVFDHQGRPLHAQDYNSSRAEHTMIADVPTAGTTTIYRAIGDLFAWLCAAATMVLVGVALMRRNRRPTHGS